jgi:hypothetical protein
MRAPFVLLVALLAVGCGQAYQTVTGDGYDQYGCKESCDRCPPLALCVGSPYVPVCLVACGVTSDCDSGTCAVIGSPSGPSVCLVAALTLCDPPVACTFTAPQCRDARTALRPLPATFKECALEPVHCDSGCDSATGSCK